MTNTAAPSPLVEPGYRKPWICLVCTLLLSQLMPEYLAPEFTLFSFVVMKRTFSRTGRKVRMGTFGKLAFLFLCYMMLGSVLYSKTRGYSMLITLLWMGMFLGQLMISNLANTRERLHCLMRCYVASASLGGVFGILQMATYYAKEKLGLIDFLFPNPVSKPLDHVVYDFLMNKLHLVMNPYVPEFRANGTFNNPNLFAAFLIVALPFAMYFFLNAAKRKDRWLYGGAILLLCGGVAAAQTRGAMLAVAVCGLFMILFHLRQFKKLWILVVGFAAVLPAWLVRYVSGFHDRVAVPMDVGDAGQMILLNSSTAEHLQVFRAGIDMIFHNVQVFLVGLGPGVNNVWKVLEDRYGVDLPHTHNIFLEQWVEGGIAGLFLFLLVGGFLLRGLVRVMKRGGKARELSLAMLGALLAFFTLGMTDYIICSPKVLQIFFLLLGFAQAVIQLFLPPEQEKATKLFSGGTARAARAAG